MKRRPPRDAGRPLRGQCLCGRVTFELSGAPVSVAHCYCRTCQQASGAPLMTWATYRCEQVKFTGDRRKRFRSSARAWRGYCGHCGSSLSWESAQAGGDIDISVALLRDPVALKPAYAIWAMSRIPWLRRLASLPHYRDAGPDHGDSTRA